MPTQVHLLLIFLCSWSFVYAQNNLTSPCINVGDCYPEVTPDANYLGTSLFGWDKCTTSGPGSLNQKSWINGGYDDVHTIANVDGTYQNIPWNSAAANEFFGPENSLGPAFRTQIQSILGLVQQTYTGSSLSPFSHWIHAKCGDETTICYKQDPCNKNGPKIISGVEAYADNDDGNGYSMITFCPAYFGLSSLSTAMTSGLGKPDPIDRFNLENYENRGRCLFHEITHLDYFMNAPPTGTNKHTWDWRVTIRTKGSSTMSADTYGPFWTKVLALYSSKSNPFGTFTSEGADNYAQYALARYVRTQLGDHPHFPVVSKNQKPTRVPILRKTIHMLTYNDTNGSNPLFDDDVLNTFLNSSVAYPDCEDDALSLSSTSNSLTMDTFFEDTDYTSEFLVQKNAWLANAYQYSPLTGQTLRILPLGDSITNGYQSTDGNGYREQVLTDLSQSSATMIGVLLSGTMADSNNDGYDGATIDQIASNPDTATALQELPNVVLLHAGTNDMNLNQDVAGAPDRLGSLIDQILAASPSATVFVALIIPSGNTATQANIINYNAAIPAVVAARYDAGHQVFLVDMYSQLIPSTDYTDDLHPNDGGYAKMGDTWVAAINYAYYELGWLNPVTAIPVCLALPTWVSQGQIANGAGLGKNIWPAVDCAYNEVSGLCDCEPVTNTTKRSEIGGLEAPTSVEEYRRSFQRRQAASPSVCQAESVPASTAVRFADLNGDGRAEYLWVDAHGAVTAFLNLGGPNNGAEAAQISWLPQGVIASGVGATRDQVLFADLNGDGRAEYLWVHPNGSVEAWLNLGGPNDGPNAAQVSWLYQGLIADGIGEDGAGVRFADLNGDGRAEYLWVDQNGAVTAYLNLGGPNDGPNAAQVGWLPQGVIATGVGGARENIVFADINGDGRAEYLVVSRTDGSVQEWYNQGGPDDGPNAAKISWWGRGTIATGVGTDGTGVVFADLNGDKRAEYIDIVANTSAINAWLNVC